ncbi:MAG: tRNA (guanosine(46)-N7)-methyltransferase TrmB [Cyanobacteriota bacterium]|nr:tRNA (guanosine(46)-N7)-methyltransferase TrmB [Cyanobacteriota bacterium]
MSLPRVRQHVNPLSQKYQKPIDPPCWEKIYPNPHQPLHLDIGCGRGRFLSELAPLQPNWNFLGLEIREPLVRDASTRQEEAGLTNLYFLFCNVSHALQPILATLPDRILKRVTIQFPDPWFKKRHQKRRVVQASLVEILATYLVPGGEVVLQSDVEDVAREMRDRFSAHPIFQQTSTEWLADNPLEVPTERELIVLGKGEPVYRTIFVRV